MNTRTLVALAAVVLSLTGCAVTPKRAVSVAAAVIATSVIISATHGKHHGREHDDRTPLPPDCAGNPDLCR